MNLPGQTVLVTGAGSGIGEMTAKRCGAADATVVVTDVDAKGGKSTVSEIQAAGGTATFLELDVRDAAAFDEVIDTVVAEHGTLDVLVNNAGVLQPPELLEDTSLETRDRLIDINIKGVWNGCRRALPVMKDAGEGVIVNVSSVGGTVGAPQLATYSLTKAAVLNFTRALAAEAGPAGVRVNAVCPGFVETDMGDEFFTAHDDATRARQQTAQMYPLRRLADPGEIADAIVFLASDRASFITGHGLVVDGGYSCY